MDSPHHFMPFQKCNDQNVHAVPAELIKVLHVVECKLGGLAHVLGLCGNILAAGGLQGWPL